MISPLPSSETISPFGALCPQQLIVVPIPAAFKAATISCMHESMHCTLPFIGIAAWCL